MFGVYKMLLGIYIDGLDSGLPANSLEFAGFLLSVQMSDTIVA
jgi:hypothetical protein